MQRNQSEVESREMSVWRERGLILWQHYQLRWGQASSIEGGHHPPDALSKIEAQVSILPGYVQLPQYLHTTIV